ncbi:hypothetical protein ILYODFUR_038204, partial [Ilyodon furcidens]
TVPHLSDLNRSVGSQMVSSGVLPNPIAVNNHQDDQVPDSACTSGPIRWKEQPSDLICIPLPSDSVSTPRDQERRTWFSDGRGPPWEHGVHFQQLEFLAKDIEVFDPGSQDSNIETYLLEGPSDSFHMAEDRCLAPKTVDFIPFFGNKRGDVGTQPWISTSNS